MELTQRNTTATKPASFENVHSHQCGNRAQHRDRLAFTNPLPLHETSCSVAWFLQVLSHEFRSFHESSCSVAPQPHEFRAHQLDLAHSTDASMEFIPQIQSGVQMDVPR